MAIPNNYIDKIKKDGDSRMISPAADKVRVDNENFEGTDLDEVLDEVAAAIDEAGSGDGTVTGVKVGNTPYDPDGQGVVDLSIPFAGKVDKNGTDSLMTAAEHTKLAGIAAGAQVNVINSISVNGTAQTPDNGNVNIVVEGGSNIDPATAAPQMDGTAAVGSSVKYAREDHVHPHDTTKLSKSDVSVETQGYGTVDINVGNDTYTINLNHTHENMAKIVKCTEATRPQTLNNDTIYVQVDNATTPTDIECLYLFGLEFTGGGLPAGVPQISKPTPNSTINLGTIYGQGGATGTIRIKGRSLTANSTVVVSVGSGFSLSYGQQSGSSINIDAADVVLGCDVTVYATAYGTEGTMMIVSQTDNISVAVDLTSDVIEDLEGVKLTGSQWLDTDYHTNPQTKIVMDCLFEKNAITENQSYSGDRGLTVINCRDSSESALILQTGKPTEQIAKAYSLQVWLQRGYSASAYNHFYEHIFGSESAFCNRSILTVDAPNQYISFQGVSWATDAKTNTQTDTLSVGRSKYSNIPFNQFDLTIYSLKLYDGAALVRDYSPKRINGVVGLLDSVDGGFISSKTQTALEPITTV